MSIDQQNKLSTAKTVLDKQPADPESEDKPRKFELSLSQVIGGALAAMTAAVLGSRLGFAGTVIGAAAASVVAAVSGAIYTASVRHTHEKVRTVWPGLGRTDTPVTVQLVSDGSQPDAATAPARRPPVRTWHSSLPSRIRLPWKNVALGALLVFGVAAMAVTGLELISGRSLSGDDGTTISQVSRHDKTDDQTSPRENQTEPRSQENAPQASSEPTDREQPTESPTSVPEETSSVPETPSASPTSTPSSAASTSPTAAQTSQPTASQANR